MATIVKVKKWRGSLAVLIPNQIAKARHIRPGTLLDLEKLEITQPRRKRYKLSELMAKFKPEHRHGEWNLGAPVGKEPW
jgi:antitoxin component of MazEF toxin-antitoxin module